MMKKNKKLIIILAVVLFLVLLLVLLYRPSHKTEINYSASLSTSGTPITATSTNEFVNYYNGTYLVDGQPVSFEGGKSVTGSTTLFMQNSNYFVMDINGDGYTDYVFYIAGLPMNNGRKYYLAAAMGGQDKYIGTNAIYLGDQIDPDDMYVTKNVVTLYYRTPAPGEPAGNTYWLPQKGQISYKDGQLVKLETEATSTDVFSASARPNNVSNVVGYFYYGAFIINAPDWLVDNWQVKSEKGEPIYTLIFEPKLVVANRDFSDINITVERTTDTNNADFMYESSINQTESSLGELLSHEVILNNKEDIRIYHMARRRYGYVTDTFYLDGNNDMTAVISFKASEKSYGIYGSKIRDFVTGLEKGTTPQG